jgi:hypothetical protein
MGQASPAGPAGGEAPTGALIRQSLWTRHDPAEAGPQSRGRFYQGGVTTA